MVNELLGLDRIDGSIDSSSRIPIGSIGGILAECPFVEEDAIEWFMAGSE